MKFSHWSLLLIAALFVVSCSDPQAAAVKELERNQYPFTPGGFVSAASMGDVNALLLFGQAGIDINSVDPVTGRSALIESANQGHIEVVTLLLKAGAKPNLLDKTGRNALIVASATGESEIVRLLLDHSADASMRDDEGWTALSLAAFHGYAPIVRQLAGQVSLQGLNEALLLAALEGNRDSVYYILNQGSSVNTRSPANLTPLMIAAEKGHLEVVELLLEHDADPTVIGKNGLTAVAIAQKLGHEEISNRLTGMAAREEPKALRRPPPATQLAIQPEGKQLVALNGSTIRSVDPGVRPVNQLKLTGYQEFEIPISLVGIERNQIALIRRRDPGGRLTELKITEGQLIPGSKYRLVNIGTSIPRPGGGMVDIERIRIQDTKSGDNYLLTLDDQVKPIDAYGVVSAELSQYRYVAKKGDIFQTVAGDLMRREFQVLQVQPSQIEVKDLASESISYLTVAP